MNKINNISLRNTLFLNLPKRLFIQLWLFSFFGLFTGGGLAQITVTGISDRQVYTNSASFTVQSEAGYDYTAELDGQPVATDVSIEVNAPQYHELTVHRQEQSTGTVESLLIRFIIRASQRDNTEVGLPVWTPYPMIDSATAEFTGGQLNIVMPAEYPVGLDIPVIARVESTDGKRRGVNGTVTGFDDQPLQLLRGVGSVFLPAATQAETRSYTASAATLETPKQIVIEENTTWQSISGSLVASTDWGENARVQITNTLTVPAGVTLTIGQGSVIVVSPDVEIVVEGSIDVNGTNGRPVVFTAQDRNAPWGGFLFETAAAEGDFAGSIFTASGADPDWFDNNSGRGKAHRDNQCLFYLSAGSAVTLNDCYAVQNDGQLGHGENAALTMTGCLVQKCVTAGQYNGGSVTMTDCALIEFPDASASYVDADNDALYLNGGPHTFTDCLFGWLLDDAIDAGEGSEGAVIFDGCWFESCFHEAMALSSGPRYATITDTVVLNCGQAIECGYDDPIVDANNCLCTGNLVGARFGDNYDWSYNGFLEVQNSLLLFNWRDIWGRAWDNWEVHLSQMDIQNNYFSKANDNYPNNTLWQPESNPSQLEKLAFFLFGPAETVGIGIAATQSQYELSELEAENQIPVRLSTFTTQSVSVDYSVSTNLGQIANGTLHFRPGQTVQHIEFGHPPLEGLRLVRITISNPTNAELTGHSNLVYEKPYQIDENLVIEGDDWKYFKGTSEPPADWNTTGFDDDAWLVGPSGFGYETGSGYESCIATNLTDMKNNYLSVYARKRFWIEDPTRITELTLTMEWDDGYIAYINGIPVDSQYPPDPVAYNEPASTSNHEACCGSGCTPRQVDLSDFIGDLIEGDNVLCVQAHNTSSGSSDFIFIPTLSAVITPYKGDFEPDGDVDIVDLGTLAQTWLARDGESLYNPVCDIDDAEDGFINLQDLAVFAQNWMTGL